VSVLLHTEAIDNVELTIAYRKIYIKDKVCDNISLQIVFVNRFFNFVITQKNY